jgi:hypothetical protein
LGLNRFPTVQTLLQIASKPTNPTETRHRALDFFTTYYHTYEYHRTDFSKVKSAFLPCEPVGGKVFLCNPADVFSNPAAAVYGFYILEKRFLADAGKFGVKTDPPSSTLTNAIIGKPPVSPAEAREKFAYAAQRVTTFSKSELARLATANIIPVPQKDGKVKYVPPTLCFLDNHARKERVWEDIFDFVDFGERGNVFLEALGVKDTPDASQIGDQLAREPRRIYDAMDIGGYLRLLSMLGTNAGVIQRDKALWTRLRAAPFLLGMKSDVAEDGTTRTIACLAKAEDIVIVDEPRLGVIFREKLVIAPERDDCEILYVALGSPHLSALVRQKFTQRGSPMTNEETEALRTHIIERAGIFLTVPEITPQVQRKADFLAQNLKIYRYDSLQVERSLVFGRIRATDTERVSAMVDSNVKGCLLLVTDPKRMNWNQVAEALNGVMLRKTNRGMDLLFETILKENLEFLRFRGFAVDRLLNRQMEEQRLAKARKDAEEEERRREEKKRSAAMKLEAERLAREAAKPENKVANGGLVGGEKGVLPGGWRDDGSLDANGAPPPYNQLTKPTNPPPVTFPTRPGFMNSIKSALGIPHPPLGGLGPLGLQGMGLGGPGGHESLETGEEPFQAQQPNPQQAQGPPQPFHTTVEGAPQNISKSAIDTQLQKAKSAVRPLNQNHLFAPATNSVVHEAPQAYCDSTTEQDLESYSPNAPTPWGLETFFPRAQRGEFERMLGAHEADVHFFAGMLKIMAADVFRVRLDSFHLFYDANKRTIAFNRSGSLFFNIAYWPLSNWD